MGNGFVSAREMQKPQSIVALDPGKTGTIHEPDSARRRVNANRHKPADAARGQIAQFERVSKSDAKLGTGNEKALTVLMRRKQILQDPLIGEDEDEINLVPIVPCGATAEVLAAGHERPTATESMRELLGQHVAANRELDESLVAKEAAAYIETCAAVVDSQPTARMDVAHHDLSRVNVMRPGVDLRPTDVELSGVVRTERLPIAKGIDEPREAVSCHRTSTPLLVSEKHLPLLAKDNEVLANETLVNIELAVKPPELPNAHRESECQTVGLCQAITIELFHKLAVPLCDTVSQEAFSLGHLEII